MAYIELAHCSKIIKDAVILDDIHLQLQQNKIYGFIGRNGSGKTMLLKLIAGLISATQGDVFLKGERIHHNQQYPAKLGVMIENNGLWPYLNAYDNLQVLASIRKEIGKAELLALLKKVGLDAAGKKVFSKFSLGMKQRLMLAQAIMEQPELLILDEPTNALDQEGVALFKEIIAQERSRGATVLIASHSLEDFNHFCDAAIHMEKGKILSFEGEGVHV